MIALSLLFGIIVVGSIWFFIGRFIWRKTFKRFIRHRPTLIVVTLLLIPVWFVGPFMDEIIGAPKFEQLCQQLPPVSFSGPVDVGPGKFFDENGKPRWKDDGDFSVHFLNEKISYLEHTGVIFILYISLKSRNSQIFLETLDYFCLCHKNLSFILYFTTFQIV